MDNILLARVLISNKLADEAQLKKMWKYIRPNKDIAAILVEIGQLKAQVYVQLVEFTYKQMGVTEFKVEAPSVLSATEQAAMLNGEIIGEATSSSDNKNTPTEIPSENPANKSTETNPIENKAEVEPTVVVSTKNEEGVTSDSSALEVLDEVVATQIDTGDVITKEIPFIEGVEPTQLGGSLNNSSSTPFLEDINTTQVGRFGGRI
jgi:hypothetical protein